MYSDKVTQSHIEKIESATKIRLHRYDVGQVLDWVPTLTRIWNDGKPTRPFTSDEHKFIRNEQILSKLDFNYWSERYSTLMLGGINETGIGKLKMWESQRLILQSMAKLEEKAWEQFARNEPVDGILIALNKSRQLGATAISRSVIMHRLTLWDHAAGFSASVDDDKVAELYQRDKRIYDNLPFYLRPSLDPGDGSIDQQSAFLKFGKLDTSILYQTSNQKSGLGQGRKFDVYHITECASFEFDGRGFAMLEHDLFPTIPQTPYTFCIAESTPQGRGTAWHLWCELIESGNMARWNYLFVPVYVEKDAKYRRTPPIDWTPTATTMAYAQKVESTSPQVIGYKFIPARDHLYWYETTRKEYAERGTLNIFLTNFACVAGDTRVSSDDGIIRIDSADTVHQVESGNVIRWHDNGVKETVTLETKMGRKLTATPSHKVFLPNGSHVPISKLKTGQAISLVSPKLSSSYETVRWMPIRTQINSVLISEDWGRLLGYYMGDGSFHGDMMNIACTANDEDVIEDVSGLFYRLVGRKPTYYNHGGCISVKSHSKHWRPLLLAMKAIEPYDSLYGWHRTVCVPPCILKSPPSVVRNFLSALFEADGHAYSYWLRTSFSSSYFSFIRDVQLLLLAFGINGQVRFDGAIASKAGGERKYQAYLLSLPAEASTKFHNDIGFISERKRSGANRFSLRYSSAGKKLGRKRIPNELVDYVKSITPAGLRKVYDLTVEKTHRYGADGILVHNCSSAESFQFQTDAAFQADLLLDLERDIVEPVTYEFEPNYN